MNCFIGPVEEALGDVITLAAERLGTVLHGEAPLAQYRGDGIFRSSVPKRDAAGHPSKIWIRALKPEIDDLPVVCYSGANGYLHFRWREDALWTMIRQLCADGDWPGDYADARTALLPPPHPLFAAQTLPPMVLRHSLDTRALPPAQLIDVDLLALANQTVEGKWTISRSANEPERLMRWCVKLAQCGHEALAVSSSNLADGRLAVLYAAAEALQRGLTVLGIPLLQEL